MVRESNMRNSDPNYFPTRPYIWRALLAGTRRVFEGIELAKAASACYKSLAGFSLSLAVYRVYEAIARGGP